MTDMQLTRRTIARLAAVLGLGGLIGWLESLLNTVTDTDDSNANENRNANASATTESTSNDGGSAASDDSSETADDDHGEWEAPDDGPIESIAVVDAADVDEDGLESPLLSIHNTDDEPRSLSVRIDHDGTTALDETNTVPADAILEVAVSDAGSYGTTVESESLRSTTSITVSDDCDGSHTEIVLGETGVRTNTSVSC